MNFSILRTLRNIGLLCGGLLLASCASTPEEPSTWSDQHKAFCQTQGWKKKVFINPPVYDKITKSRGSVKVSIVDQRAYLLLDDEHVAMDFPIATGRKSHRTPTGGYKVLQMKEDYASNLYGRFVDIESGETIDSNADSRHSTPEGAKFVGAKMPNWMRLTNTGVGMHIGYVPGRPASHGCIRVVRPAMEKLYPVCHLGTKVEVLDSWNPWDFKLLYAQSEG